MGLRTAPRSPMAWMSSLGEMAKYGTRLKLACPRCPGLEVVDREKLMVERGPDFMVFDAREPCPTPGCQELRFYLGSPGQGTPFRPLKSY